MRGHRAKTRLVYKLGPLSASFELGRVLGGKCTGFRELGLKSVRAALVWPVCAWPKGHGICSIL